MSRPGDWVEVFGFGDPTPGDPWGVRGVARSYAALADDAGWAKGRVSAALSDAALSGWIGEAGEVFRSKMADLPGQLGKCEDSFGLAADALSWWAGRLEAHQGDADRALVTGRAAKADLVAAQARLDSAESSVAWASGSSVLELSQRWAGLTPPSSVVLPTSQEVAAAQARLRSAQASMSSAQSEVSAAASRLEVARGLALDARSLREADARTTAARVREASDAGIPERSWWDRHKEEFAAAWHVIVEVAKVVVAVLGVVALIIGGPIAWVVFAAALIVLANTLYEYSQGRASLWDVALAALACIPMTKGLTSLGALSAAFKEGGALAAGAHVLAAGRTALVEMAGSVRSLGAGIRTAFRGFVDGGLLKLDGAFGSSETMSSAWMSFRSTIHELRGGEFTSEGNLVLKRWTPVDEVGPLGPGYPANTFRSNTYNEVLVVHPTQLNRSVPSGGNLNGGFWTHQAPAGPLGTQLDYALLPEWNKLGGNGSWVALPQATHTVQAEVPVGVHIFEGPAGPQVATTGETVLVGGAQQVFLRERPPEWLLPGIKKVGGS